MYDILKLHKNFFDHPLIQWKTNYELYTPWFTFKQGKVSPFQTSFLGFKGCCVLPVLHRLFAHSTFQQKLPSFSTVTSSISFL